jgi:hypothetical protein
MTGEGFRRGRGLKDRVDKSMGIVTHITEVSSKINYPGKILVSQCVWEENRRTKSSCTWPEVFTVTGRKNDLVSLIRVDLTIMRDLFGGRVFHITVWLRSSTSTFSFPPLFFSIFFFPLKIRDEDEIWRTSVRDEISGTSSRHHRYGFQNYSEIEQSSWNDEYTPWNPPKQIETDDAPDERVRTK